MHIVDQINHMDIEAARKVRVPDGQYKGRTVADVGRSKAGREYLHNARQLYPVMENADPTNPSQVFALAIRAYLVKTE